MTLPALLFGALIASLYGAVYHLIRDGRPGRLLLYLVIGNDYFSQVSYPVRR